MLTSQNPVNINLIEVVLRRMGHDPFLAPDGEVALELAKQRKFDLVLMDIQMPKYVSDSVAKGIPRIHAMAVSGVHLSRNEAKRYCSHKCILLTTCCRMDGIQATKAIRQLADWADIPIIGLTAGYVKDNAPKYIEAGMSECIAKPFRMQELQRVIQQFCRKDTLMVPAT